MKSSLRKLRGLGRHRSDPKETSESRTQAQQDELMQASQDMLDMRNCYDSLLSAAAATANSAYEFAEALREMGTCLLEGTAANDDKESGKVLLMLGKAQFELQKLVDSYRVHIVQTITTPSESLIKELQTVEEMKRQCDDKRDLYQFMLAAQKEKGSSKSIKGENVSSQKLKAAKEDFDEEANLFVFRLKSLKQGQSRSLLTQAARHHAAQLNFFRKGVKSLELVEPQVKVLADQQHIDYQFSGLEDDNTGEVDDSGYVYDGNDDDGDELRFNYIQNIQGQGVPLSKNSTEENFDRIRTDFTSLSTVPWAGSQSAPILADKLEASERTNQPLSTRKLHTYALPTPADAKISVLNSGNPDSTARIESKGGMPPQLWYSSQLEQSKPVKEVKGEPLSPRRISNAQSVLKESNINSGPIKMPPPLVEGSSLPQFHPHDSFDTKRTKRQAFSGPLPSQARRTKPVCSAADNFLSEQYLPSARGRQTSVSPNASPPPMLSPRINELHELPRPPSFASKPTRPSTLVGHSAPLVSRGQELSAGNLRPSVTSQRASPLPIPPLVMSRSFSIPSSGQRTPALTVSKLLEVPRNFDMREDISPPLTPISLRSPQLASGAITQSAEPKGESYRS
ncbi:uncharacterized protein M6B38_258570 [Iris pallida]|uniref:BAR domain-containing protein n=1 Tax=Iris pallida TaxID=29817 RepID=A0AAX6IEZ0_IRIPA|nr:uncharacterized protein M6B38_258570 [Iris pallida]